MQHVNQEFDQVWLLEEIAATEALTCKCIDKSHSVLEHLSRAVQESLNHQRMMLIDILVGRISRRFLAVKQIVVLVGVDNELYQLLALGFRQSPSESL